MVATNKDSRPWYREPWPWLLMAGPAAVIVAGVITLWLAIDSNDGLVADDYYKQGLAVNQVLERSQRAAELGVRADLMRSGNQLRVLLRAPEGTALPERLSFRIMHPTRAGMDQALILAPDGQGFYGGKLTQDISGHWKVTLEDAGSRWRLEGLWQADSAEPQHLSPGSGDGSRPPSLEANNGVGTPARQ